MAAPLLNVEQLIASPEAYRGQCVRVRGVADGRRLFPSLDGYYRADRYINSEGAANALGLYMPRGARPVREPTYVEFSGKAGSCEADYLDAQERIDAEDSNAFVFLTGYCHYSGGAYLKVVDADVLPNTWLRPTSDEDRERLNGLIRASPGWAAMPVVHSLLERWLEAARTGDRKKIAQMTFIDGQSSEETHDARAMQVAKSVLETKRQSALFAIGEPYVPGDLAIAYQCVCRETDCTNRWPVTRADATWSNRRPYRCVQLIAGDDDGHPPNDYGAIEVSTDRRTRIIEARERKM